MTRVEVRSLDKRFGNFQAVTDVSFAVAPGEAFALLGPNGSGKTTTLKVIAGLAPPSSGQVLVDGIDVWRRPREAKARFSYLPQRVAFPENLTALEVVRFYARLRHLPESRAAESLAMVELDRPDCAGKPVGAFSGGMTQRLGIAVTLVSGASLLIFDEPTANLDPEGAGRFLAIVGDLKRAGTTVLFSSHVLSDVETVADRAALLLDGRLVAGDSVRALRPALRRTAAARAGLEESSVQELYWRYIHEKNPDPRGDGACGVPQRAAAAD